MAVARLASALTASLTFRKRVLNVSTALSTAARASSTRAIVVSFSSRVMTLTSFSSCCRAIASSIARASSFERRRTSSRARASTGSSASRMTVRRDARRSLPRSLSVRLLIRRTRRRRTLSPTRVRAAPRRVVHALPRDGVIPRRHRRATPPRGRRWRTGIERVCGESDRRRVR